jgi:hypothetical protein
MLQVMIVRLKFETCRLKRRVVVLPCPILAQSGSRNKIQTPEATALFQFINNKRRVVYLANNME